MGHLLPLKLASITDKSADQMAVRSWPRYITHLDPEQTLQPRATLASTGPCSAVLASVHHDAISFLPPYKGINAARRGQRSPQRQYLLLWTAWDHYLTRVPWPKPVSSSPVDIHWHALTTVTTAVHHGCSLPTAGQAEFVPWPEGAFSWTERICCQLGQVCGDGHAIIFLTDVRCVRSSEPLGLNVLFTSQIEWNLSHFLMKLSVFFSQVTNFSIYRPSVALRLPLLQVLDGERITLEERTRAELLSIEEIVKTPHNTHENRHVWTRCCKSSSSFLKAAKVCLTSSCWLNETCPVDNAPVDLLPISRVSVTISAR